MIALIKSKNPDYDDKRINNVRTVSEDNGYFIIAYHENRQYMALSLPVEETVICLG